MIRYLAFLLVFVPGVLLAGGGWPKKKGTGYYKLTHWWLVSEKHYVPGGSQLANPKTGIFTTSLYAEYGITDKLTGILYFPFVSKASRQEAFTSGSTTLPVEDISGIGDTDIGFKYALSKPGSQFAFAGTLILGLPLGNDGGGTNESLETGDGEFNQMLRFDLSRSAAFGKVSAYANVYSGFNNRNNDFSDEVRFGGEAGVSFLNNKLWFILRLDIVRSLDNGAANTGDFPGATIFANNTEFSAYGYQAAVYVTKNIGVSASYTTAFSGQNIFATPSYSMGIFFDMN